MTEAKFNNQAFIFLVVIIVKKENEKAVDFDSKREDQRSKFLKAAYSTGTRPASSSSRIPTDVADERTNKRACS